MTTALPFSHYLSIKEHSRAAHDGDKGGMLFIYCSQMIFYTSSLKPDRPTVLYPLKDDMTLCTEQKIVCPDNN